VPARGKFARRLNGRFNLPFYTHDERLTTFEAKGERLVRGGQKGSYRDNPVDAIAAALLLQGWLDENTHCLNPDKRFGAFFTTRAPATRSAQEGATMSLPNPAELISQMAIRLKPT
jgi:hypothetical protein